MDKNNFIFAPGVGENPVITVHNAGFVDSSSPRHHAKGAGFIFEYVLSGEECVESPDMLINAGIGSLIIIHPSEECVLYRAHGEVSAIQLSISGFVLEAVSDVLSLPRIFCGVTDSSKLIDTFLRIPGIYNEYTAGSGDCGRILCETAFSMLLDAAAIGYGGSSFTDGRPTAEKIKAFLDLCLCGNIDLDMIGKKFGITGMHAIRLFRSEYDITPMLYLKNARLERSAVLLENTDMSIKEISTLLQFSTTQHFTNQFREYFGISPGKYRDRKKHI